MNVLLLLSVISVLMVTKLYNSVYSVKRFHHLFVLMVNTMTMVLLVKNNVSIVTLIAMSVKLLDPV